MSTIGGSNIGDGPDTIGGSNISIHDHDRSGIGGGAPAPVRTFAGTIGDGVTTVFAVTHGLGTLDTQTSVYNPITGTEYLPTAYTAVHTNPNVTTFTFVAAPAAGAARVVIQA
jgi:hypothetical protein